MTTEHDDIEAISQLAADWRSGWLAGDVEALLSLYAKEPVLMPQDQPALVGREAIRRAYELVLNQWDFKSEGTVKEIVVSGDLGYFWSVYTLRATSKTGVESFKVTGKSLFIVTREAAGPWKISRLMDNSDGITPGEYQ
jgi:uncharacterized protein (TIGR02246 family)